MLIFNGVLGSFYLYSALPDFREQCQATQTRNYCVIRQKCDFIKQAKIKVITGNCSLKTKNIMEPSNWDMI